MITTGRRYTKTLQAYKYRFSCKNCRADEFAYVSEASGELITYRIPPNDMRGQNGKVGARKQVGDRVERIQYW